MHPPRPLRSARFARRRVPGGLRTALLMLCVASGCAGEEGDTRPVTARDSAGVELVDIAGPAPAPGWRVEELVRIDPVEAEGSEGFFEASSVAVLEGDRIAVVDRTGPRVVLLDSTGTVLAVHGREGEGPGEFRLPLAAVARPGGGVAVWDAGNRRLERFDETLRATTPVRLRERPFGGRIARLEGDRLVMAVTAGGREAQTRELVVVEGALEGDPDADRDAVVLASMPLTPGGRIDLESCGMGFSGLPPIFAPDLRWDARPGVGAVVVRSDRWEIDILEADEGRLQRRIRRDLVPTSATLDLAVKQIGEGMRVRTPEGERVCDPTEVAEARGVAETVPLITRLAIAPSGDLWVERRIDGGGTTVIDVVDSGGGLRGTLPEGTPFPAAFLADGRIVEIREDDLGRRSVVVHRVVPGRPTVGG